MHWVEQVSKSVTYTALAGSLYLDTTVVSLFTNFLHNGNVINTLENRHCHTSCFLICFPLLGHTEIFLLHFPNSNEAV